MTNYSATVNVETLTGTAGADNFYVNRQTYLNSGDIIDGGDGTDILWVTKGMMGVDMPGNLDFQGIAIQNIEELNFNYMAMPMPGQAVFSSSQFGTGLMSNALVVRGTWGSNDLVVNLVAGESSFDASGWTFPTNAASTPDANGIPSGTATSMWGAYIYTGPNTDYAGLNVGTPTTPTMHASNPAPDGSDWPAGVIYQNGLPGDTVTLNGSAGANAIVGSIVSDILRGGEGADTLTGGAGNDFIDGGNGDDTAIFSGNYDDYTITNNAGTLTVADKRVGAANGTDTLTGIEALMFGSATWPPGGTGPYYATAAVDLLIGDYADEDLVTNKQAYLNAGDIFDGGAGIDTLWAGQGMGETEPDGLYDENYDFSSVAIRNVEALAFNYMPMPMPGQAVFSSSQFGTGLLSDSLKIFGAWDRQDITVNLVSGNSSFDASGWTFANAGSNSGTKSDIWGHYTYTGNGMFKGKDVGGNDTIHLKGSSGDNSITGSSAADILSGGGGTDILKGGRGDDVYLTDGGDTILEAAAGGTDLVISSVSAVLGANVERMTLTGGALNGKGNALSNVLYGNAQGNDLKGLSGDDFLRSGAGNDTLTGGAGRDWLTGSAGNDKFVFAHVSESTALAGDRIIDFMAGDKIDVSTIDANSGLGGMQNFVLDASGNTSFAAGHVKQTKIGDHLVLDFNTDSDAAAEMRIYLLDRGAVKASDFIL